MSYTISKLASISELASSSNIASILNGPITNVSIDLSNSSSSYKFMYSDSWGSGTNTTTLMGLGSSHSTRSTKTNTYSKSTFSFTVPKMFDKKVDITFFCYQNGEINWDYGIFGALDKELSASNKVDASENIHATLKGKGSASTSSTAAGSHTWPANATLIKYSNIPAGDHTIDIKYHTDSGGNYGADNMIITNIFVKATIGMLLKSNYKARNISEYYDYEADHWETKQVPLDYQVTSTGTYTVDITKEMTGRNYILWRFIPAATGIYKFNVKRESFITNTDGTNIDGTSSDTGGSLWKATSGTTMPSAGATSGSLIDNDDSSSYGHNQPGFSYECTAGVCYFFQLTYFSPTIRKTFAPENPEFKISPGKYTLAIEWASSISLTATLESGYSAASNDTYIAYLKKNGSDIDAETVYIYPNSTSVLYPFGCDASNTLLYRSSGSGGWRSPVLMSEISLNTEYLTYNDLRSNPHWSYNLVFTKK